MVSNIPLSVEGLTLAGAPGAAVLAVQAPIDGDGLRHFMVAAAGGGLTLNVIADTATMPDLHHYIELLRASFDDLAAAARCRLRIHLTKRLPPDRSESQAPFPIAGFGDTQRFRAEPRGSACQLATIRTFVQRRN
ncbi:hypothetical protein N806_24110 [Rhodococcus sp. P27]|nr:hypothetical protein N806_24110 [Rhodococcus sp. P27]